MLNKIKQKKHEIKLIFVFLILIILINNCFLIIAPEPDKNLNDYYGDDKVKDFINLNTDEKNELWNSDENIFHRDGLSTKIIEDIRTTQNNKAIGNAIRDSLARGSFNVFSTEAEKVGLKDLLGLDLGKLKESGGYDRIKQLALDFGLNIDSLYDNTPLTKVSLSSKDLSWKDKNIIGNGKVWLNLDKLPPFIKAVEYVSSSSGGKFILTTKIDQKIILGEGATNEKGEIVFLQKYGKKNEKGEINGYFLGNMKLPNSDLSGFIVSGKAGDFEITSEGIRLKGKIDVKFGVLKLSSDGLSNGFGYANFNSDRIIVKGIQLEREGYFRVPKTSQDFIVHFGDLSSLAKTVSFNDYGKIEYDSASDMPGFSLEDISKVYFKFDENGKVTHVSKKGFNDNDWIEIKSNSRVTSENEDSLSIVYSSLLSKIYDGSGKVVQNMLDDVAVGKSLNYNELQKRFYGDNDLKKAGQIKIDSYASNFLSFSGDSVSVGGTGNVELLRNYPSLVGVDASNFIVNTGKFDIRFDGDKIDTPRVNPNQASIILGSISAMKKGVYLSQTYEITSDGVFRDNIDGKDSYISLGKPSGIIEVKNGEGKVIIPKASFELSLEVPAGEVQKIEGEIDNNRRTNSIIDTNVDNDKIVSDAILSRESQLTLRANIPLVEGLKLDSNGFKEVFEGVIWPELVKKLENEVVIPIQGKDMTFSPETRQLILNIKDQVLQTLLSTESFSVDQFSVSFRNNPNKDKTNQPSLIISSGQNRLGNIILKEREGEFISQVLKAATLVPDVEKGAIKDPYTWIEKLGTDAKENFYSYNPLLQRMADRIGLRDSSVYLRNKMPGEYTKDFMINKDPEKLGFINTYFVPKKK